jgi:hypothetical protein
MLALQVLAPRGAKIRLERGALEVGPNRFCQSHLEYGDALRLKRPGSVQIEEGDEFAAVLDGDESVAAFPHQTPAEERRSVVNPESAERGERFEAQTLPNEKRRLLGIEGEDGTRPRPQIGNKISEGFVRSLPGIIRDQQRGQPIDVTHVHLSY